MTIYNVSGASQLASAINSANGGDEIRLAGGNYGRLNLSKNFNGNVTITSASDGNKATFTGVEVRNAANVTFDSLRFDGGGRNGTGLKVSLSNNVAVTDSDFSDFLYGMSFSRVTNLNVRNNDVSGMWNDCMRFAQVINATITGNDFEQRNSQPNYSHKDLIQFWTSGAEGPSRHVTISGNRMDSPDGETHAIYMGNAEARSGNRSKFYQDIVIENNTIRTSHVHGISVEHVDGVSIRNNNVIHNRDWGITKVVSIPLINVSSISTDVRIIGNTAPSVPNEANSSWSVANNRETSNSGSLIHWNGIVNGRSGAASNLAASSALDADGGADGSAGGGAGDGAADIFRFSGSAASRTAAVQGLDFGEGDTLVFADYDAGTFRDVDGGNAVGVGAAGTSAVVDSLADLRELDQASQAIRVTANRATDVLVLEIAQGEQTQRLALQGLADEYLAL